MKSLLKRLYPAITPEEMEEIAENCPLSLYAGDCNYSNPELGLTVVEIDHDREDSYDNEHDNGRCVLVDITLRGQTHRIAGETDNSSWTEWREAEGEKAIYITEGEDEDEDE